MHETLSTHCRDCQHIVDRRAQRSYSRAVRWPHATPPTTAPARGRRASRVSAQERETATSRDRRATARGALGPGHLGRRAGARRRHLAPELLLLLPLQGGCLPDPDRSSRRAGRGWPRGDRPDPRGSRQRAGGKGCRSSSTSSARIARWCARAPSCGPSTPRRASCGPRVMEKWVGYAAGAIEAERAGGAAPAGVEARQLAIALVSMNERVQYATFAAEPPSLADDAVMDVLLEIWLRAIYGEAASSVSADARRGARPTPTGPRRRRSASAGRPRSRSPARGPGPTPISATGAPICSATKSR